MAFALARPFPVAAALVELPRWLARALASPLAEPVPFAPIAIGWPVGDARLSEAPLLAEPLADPFADPFADPLA